MRVVANNSKIGLAGLELIERLRISDYTAMEIIYNDHKKSALLHMRKFNNEEDILNDIYQDTMEVIFKKSLEPNFNLTCDLQGYINRVCRNLLLNRIKIEKKQKEIFQIPEEEEEVINLNIENVSLFNKVWKQMKKLSEKCFEIINRTYLLEETNENVAEAMGYKDELVFKNIKSRCLRKLRVDALKIKIHS